MPFEYDQVNIVCPVYAPGTHESDAEKYIIYNVSTEHVVVRVPGLRPRPVDHSLVIATRVARCDGAVLAR